MIGWRRCAFGGLAALLAGCSGPVTIALPQSLEQLVPGASLHETIQGDELGEAESGITVGRLTGRGDDAAPVQAEPGDRWPDPVPAPPTLGELAATLHLDDENRNDANRFGPAPGAPPPAVVQPRRNDLP